MGKVTLALSLCAAGMAGAALALELTEPDVTERLVFVHNASHGDDTDDKGVRASCPPGAVVIGGGAAVNHGHANAPSVALYQGLPIQGGWEVQGHETDPEDAPRQPWTLESVVICLRE